GQIGLPAGMQDRDETLERTACREAEEEIGIDAGALSILGPLSPVYIPPSHIVLHPFVGHLPEAPTLRALPREVTRIFEIPLMALIEPATLQVETRRIQEREIMVPYFALAGEKIWGATAIVLAELRYLIGGSSTADHAARKRAT
ncbi:MAG TPA: CoA pyrophosphatase, partial [Candidatus Eisenbacteria bacterium]|nr:CoA pyrophosphatase [Candidatus Eisenbacteria bacterium]